jgi:hypothetical protein
MIEMIEATPLIIPAIARDIRAVDAMEMQAMTGLDVIPSLLQCLDLSPAWFAVLSDEILGIYGIQEVDEGGVPWMICCNAFDRHRFAADRQAKKTIDGWKESRKWLANRVHANNGVAISWLRKLGFKIEDPIPYGAMGELFSSFRWEREDYV